MTAQDRIEHPDASPYVVLAGRRAGAFPNEIGTRPKPVLKPIEEQILDDAARNASKPLSGGAWIVIAMMFGCVCLGFGVWLGAKADHASMCQAMQTYGVRCEGVL